jgi:hypothetical protein
MQNKEITLSRKVPLPKATKVSLLHKGDYVIRLQYRNVTRVTGPVQGAVTHMLQVQLNSGSERAELFPPIEIIPLPPPPVTDIHVSLKLRFRPSNFLQCLNFFGGPGQCSAELLSNITFQLSGYFLTWHPKLYKPFFNLVR